jgi:RNA polymerase sigma factor (sigma-70 family)
MEELFRLARQGDQDAFARWMGLVEMLLRRSLWRFARAVDVEVVVQETFMRMWIAARDQAREITGANASLKFAFRVARNVALEELRRARQDIMVDLNELDELSEGRIETVLPDPALARAIRDCRERLPDQPRRALSARIDQGHLPDRALAERLRMKANTFLQNIVRARRLLRECLERRGVRLGEILS